MFSKKYRLSYLPLFYEDLDEKVTYIAEKLKNPKAANDLLDKVESAIMERLPVADLLNHIILFGSVDILIIVFMWIIILFTM